MALFLSTQNYVALLVKMDGRITILTTVFGVQGNVYTKSMATGWKPPLKCHCVYKASLSEPRYFDMQGTVHSKSMATGWKPSLKCHCVYIA
jgi:hypothetical protein